MRRSWLYFSVVVGFAVLVWQISLLSNETPVGALRRGTDIAPDALNEQLILPDSGAGRVEAAPSVRASRQIVGVDKLTGREVFRGMVQVPREDSSNAVGLYLGANPTLSVRGTVAELRCPGYLVEKINLDWPGNRAEETITVNLVRAPRPPVTVLTRAGVPVYGVALRLVDIESPTPGVPTDSAGNAAVATMPLDRWSVEIEGDQIDSHVIPPGQVSLDRLILNGTALIRAVPQSEITGEDVLDVGLQLWKYGSADSTPEFVSLPLASWALLDVVPGRYSVRLTNPGWILVNQGEEVRGLDLELGVGPQSLLTELELRRAAGFRLQVTSASDGSPLERVTVTSLLRPGEEPIPGWNGRAASLPETGSGEGNEVFYASFLTPLPTEALAIEITAVGFSPAVVDLPLAAMRRGEVPTIRQVLDPDTLIAAAVVDPLGAPLRRAFRILDPKTSVTVAGSEGRGGNVLLPSRYLGQTVNVAVEYSSSKSQRAEVHFNDVRVPLGAKVEIVVPVGTLRVVDTLASELAVGSPSGSLIWSEVTSGQVEFEQIPSGEVILGSPLAVGAALLARHRGQAESAARVRELVLDPGAIYIVRDESGLSDTRVTGSVEVVGIDPEMVFVVADADPNAKWLPNVLGQNWTTVTEDSKFEINAAGASRLLLAKTKGFGMFPNDIYVIGGGPVGERLHGAVGVIDIIVQGGLGSPGDPWYGFLEVSIPGLGRTTADNVQGRLGEPLRLDLPEGLHTLRAGTNPRKMRSYEIKVIGAQSGEVVVTLPQDQ